MKKILLTILAVLAMSGMAMAQTAPSDINLHRNDDGSWSFIMPGRNLVMSTETFSTNDTVNGHYLAGVPEGWLILALGDTVPVSNDSLRRTTPITEGTPVTIVPTGNLRRIKSITLVDELPPAPAVRTLAEATAEDKGKLIGADGNIYDDAAAATAAGTTAVAKIIYIGTTGHATYSHGLALALTDEGQMAWEAAKTACNTTKNTSTPVTGATWLLASKDQWDYMLGTNGAGSYTALRDGFSDITGASNLQSSEYWSSTEHEDSGWALYITFKFGKWSNRSVGTNYQVRACLAF